MDQGGGDRRVVFVEGVGLDEEIEDGGDYGDGGCVCGDVDSGEVWVAEDDGDAEVADVPVFKGSGYFGVFSEGLAAIIKMSVVFKGSTLSVILFLVVA